MVYCTRLESGRVGDEPARGFESCTFPQSVQEFFDPPVAQLEEYDATNVGVAGSSPAGRSSLSTKAIALISLCEPREQLETTTMKTIGEQAKEFRLARGWSTTRMAKEVGTSRQNIESLESTGDRQPQYLVRLSVVMGASVDDLLHGRFTTTPSEEHPIESSAQNEGHLSPIAQRIAQKRNELGLSVKKLAEHIGVSIQSIYFYEKGEREPSGENLFSLADALGVSARWLVLGVEDGTAKPAALPRRTHPAILQSTACLDAFLASDGSDVNLVRAASNILKSALSSANADNS